MIAARPTLLAAAAATLCLLATFAAAQKPEFRIDAERLNAIIAPFDQPGQPGGVVLIQRDGLTLYEKGFGLASIEHGVANSPSTVFKISYGECREFAAMAVAMLAKHGVLSLDDSVRKHLPELPPYAQAIKVRHLLNHNSGLPDYGVLFLLTGWQMHNPLSDEDFFRVLGRIKDTDFPPGSGYMYSNTDYALLAFIVQRATGISLREVCERDLFKPLGMAATRVDDQLRFVVPNRAYQYFQWPEGMMILRREKTSPAGRNGVLTTVGDLAKWGAALNDPKSMLAAVAMDLRASGPCPPDRPGEHVFGHYLREDRGLSIVTHRGIDDVPYLVCMPTERVTIALLKNGPLDAGDVMPKLIDAVFFNGAGPSAVSTGLPHETLSKWKALAAQHPEGVALSKEELQQLAGDYKSLIKSRGRDQTFVLDQDKLFALFDDARDPVVPLGDGVFHCFTTFMEVQPSFGNDPLRIKAYRESTGELVDEFELLPPAPALDAAKLASLAGRYYNHELDVTWQLHVRDGAVFLKRERMADAPLAPTADDVFALQVLADVDAYVFDVKVTIVRDEKGNATRFLVSSARVKGLAFNKIAAGAN